MKTIRLISTFLYLLTSILAIGYIATSVYVLISTWFKLPSLKRIENGRFAINYPFTQKAFLLGSEFSLQYISEMVIGIGFYGVFFLLLSHVFYTFKQERLFTLQGVGNLSRFYIFNLFVAPILLIILASFSMEDLPYGGMIFAHLIFGVFALFIATIFRQGLNLQNEQDLFI
ncbi:conserved membrane hypothetical protein [Flavobacterium sp. 9AF]|uniref:DUF2975 domain-containing protein n=1 Tax=Flavobacterium sp. 9AF TaxID=2653142 RepID=UPI0012F3B169|nr:DUF2975 domain-containing protein [Flavobacterium sp. 9AF]VXA92303.1 conserved membrane hypothetical protein [Flavobacterium sp. 9AF]